MLALRLNKPAGRPLSVLAIGAHPDDIEIGAGGTLLALAASEPGLIAHYVVLTGSPERQLEARAAAAAFLPGADLTIGLHTLREGRLPAAWAQVKDVLEDVASRCAPDLIFAPSAADAHQDHRTIGEIVPTVFRDQLYLAYEIPKWDGDFGRPSTYLPMSVENGTAQGRTAAQVLSVPAQSRLVGRRSVSRPGTAPWHGVPCALRRGIHVREVGDFRAPSSTHVYPRK